MNNTCVCCDAIIPEGRQVCKKCEGKHECEHYIGVLYDWEDTDLITLKGLKEEVERNCSRYGTYEKGAYTLADYCDKRKTTNFTRFEYCPICGKKIDWKAIRKENNNV